MGGGPSAVVGVLAAAIGSTTPEVRRQVGEAPFGDAPASGDPASASRSRCRRDRAFRLGRAQGGKEPLPFHRRMHRSSSALGTSASIGLHSLLLSSAVAAVTATSSMQPRLAAPAAPQLRAWSQPVARSLQEAASTTTETVTATTTTTSIYCDQAMSACDCAVLGICGWATDASGGGRCVHIPDAVPGTSLVECDFCPQQAHCPGQGCGAEATPCACAAAEQGCRWELNIDGGECVVRGADEPATGCNLCPSQSHCEVFIPQVLSFEPANGGYYEGGHASIRVRIWFSVPISWCENADSQGSGVAVWCRDRVPELEELSRAWLSIADSAMSADLSGVLGDLVLNDEHQCGVTIAPNTICSSSTNVPFPGFSEGEYRFVLRDTVPPALLGFSPRNGMEDVALDGAIDLAFDEKITIGLESYAVATLSQLEVGDYSGITTTVLSKRIPLTSPQASVDGKLLKVQLGGHLQPGLLYSLSLPQASVVDLAGNEFVGLLPNAYTFRTTVIALRSTASLGDGQGLSVVAVIAIVTGSVAVIGLVVVMAIRVLRVRSAHWTYLEEAPSISRVIPKPAKPQKPSFSPAPRDPGGAAAGGASPASATPTSRPPAPYSSSAPQAEAPGHGGAWAYRAPGSGARGASAYAGPSPSPASGPAGRGTSGGSSGGGGGAAGSGAPGGAKGGSSAPSGTTPPKAKASGPGPGTSKPPPTFPGPRAHQKKASVAPAPVVEDNRCPEVRAVEKQMRNMMDEPLAVRKKAMKDLMLEYHPDKNKQANAKEVFQYVNNAKSWFLQGS